MIATSRRPAPALSFVLLAFLWALAVPATAAEPRDATAKPANGCEHPCVHVEDCPKVTCECAEASGSGVAACDADVTHCCLSANTACERFCEVHHQTWTGRYTPEGNVRPKPASDAGDGAKDASAAAAPCAESCEKAEDCRTITCQCANGTAEHVAACDGKTHCCGAASVVCEHFCSGKKGKWTGKVVEAAPKPGDLGKSFRDLYDGVGDPDRDGDRDGERDGERGD